MCLDLLAKINGKFCCFLAGMLQRDWRQLQMQLEEQSSTIIKFWVEFAEFSSGY